MWKMGLKELYVTRGEEAVELAQARTAKVIVGYQFLDIDSEE